MEILRLHPWRVSPSRAGEIQRSLRGRIQIWGGPRRVRRIAGADVSYGREHPVWAAAGVVVLSWPELEVLEERTATGLVTFPYVPGFLSFREGPLLLQAFARLRFTPDLIFFDGQGVAHPRGLGLACHLGLLLERPSVGCGKSLLYGRAGEPGPRRGDRAAILSEEGRTLGMALRTREGVKPIFVSPGHRIGGEEAAEWALRTSLGHRVPQPIRLAHLLVNRQREALEGRRRGRGANRVVSLFRVSP